MATIASWLNLADEEEIELWNENTETTSVSYTYCDSFTVSNGVLTAVSPTTVSRSHSGNFDTFKGHYVRINGNEWYLIPSDSVITVSSFSSNPAIYATKCQLARAGRTHWSEADTVVFRNRTPMTETTVSGGITWQIYPDIEHTLTFGTEVKEQSGSIVLVNAETDTVTYEEAVAPVYWEWLKEFYVSKSGIYYIPDNAVFTFTQQSGYREVNVAPVVVIGIATMPSYPYTIEERPNQDEDYIDIGYQMSVGDVSEPITFYGNCSVGTDGSLVYSNPQQLTLTAPSDADWDANGAQYYSAQYQGKYDGIGSVIPSNALIQREVMQIPIHYRLEETTANYAWWTRFGRNGYVPPAPFAVNGKTDYYDGISLNPDTGEITGVGKHTYSWDSLRTSDFPFVGKYTLFTSPYTFGAFGTWIGWCIYNHMYLEYEMYSDTWIFNVGIRPVRAVGDQFLTKYNYTIQYNYVRATQSQFQTDVCLKNTGRKQLIDTDFNGYGLRAQLSWAMDTALEPALETSISDFVYGHLWDFAIGHLDYRIVNIVQTQYGPVAITRAEGWYFHNDTDTAPILAAPASSWTNIKYFDVDTRTRTFTVNNSTFAAWVSPPQGSPYVFGANGQTDDYRSAEISVYGLRQSGWYFGDNYEILDIRQDFIPCIKKSTWDAGLYDMSEGIFYNNVGSGFFDYIGSKLYIFDDEASDAEEKYGGGQQNVSRQPLGGGVNPSSIADAWIQSDGRQYIDTGVTANKYTRVELRYMEAGSLDTKSAYVLGARDLDDRRGDSKRMVIESSPNGLFYSVYKSSYQAWRVINSLVHQIVITGTGKHRFNSNNLRGTNAQWRRDDVTARTIYLFACNNNGIAHGLSAMRLYYCKIWQASDLVRDFVPKLQNGKAGLYDNVTHEFFPNKGIGSFTYSSNITSL